MPTDAPREMWVLGRSRDDAWSYIASGENVDIFDSRFAADEAKFGRLEPHRFAVTFHYNEEELNAD